MREYWAVITGFVALISWAVRAEAGMRSNTKRQTDMEARFEREIRGLWKQRNEDLEASREARGETNRFLERLDFKMDAAFSEFRSDIKTLLQRKGD